MDPRLVLLAARAQRLAEAGRQGRLTARLHHHLNAIDRLIQAAEAREKAVGGEGQTTGRRTGRPDAGALPAGLAHERDLSSLNKERIAVEIAIGIATEEAGWSEHNLEKLLQISARLASDSRASIRKT